MGTVEHFRFAPDILSRLGEELVPHADQGIIELVRNAYDADALKCTVELHGVDEAGGTIVVQDTGKGMLLEDIRDGWLLLGKSRKKKRERTALGRIPVGDKGLGRLAALRLGNVAVLKTRPELEPGVEYTVTIDWRRFDNVDYVENVPVEIKKASTELSKGTRIELRDLSTPFGRREVKRLARALILLSSPFPTDKEGFEVALKAPEFKEFEDRVAKGYLSEAEYHLEATLGENGRATVKAQNRLGTLVWDGQHEQMRRSNEPYKAPQCKFEMWIYLLSGAKFANRQVTKGEIADWLDVVGGVHVYHHGLRVPPYGDAGNDWLDLNLARARSPEERPSTNTSVGRIVVFDEGRGLIQKTDRSGFIHNEAFAELREFAKDALDWLAKRRLRAAEARRKKKRAKTASRVNEAKKRLSKAVRTIDDGESRKEVREAANALDGAHKRREELLQEEVDLYRTLGTVGTTTAVFSHEAGQPITQIEKTIGLVRRRVKKLVPMNAFSDRLAQPITIIENAAKALKNYARLPLTLLERTRRRTKDLDLHKVVYGVSELFRPFLEHSFIKMDYQFADKDPIVRGSAAEVEAIVANLLTNALSAFGSMKSVRAERRVVIRTSLEHDRVILSVLDSGPGIRGIELQDIWIPGQSTLPNGTGLGLTIVKDSAEGLGGEVHAIAQGEIGGAEFVVGLPVKDLKET